MRSYDIGCFYVITPSLRTSFRRPTPQKAWTSGMNPITQRSTTPAQQNCAGSQGKVTTQKFASVQETSTPEKHANDRLLYLLGNFMVNV